MVLPSKRNRALNFSRALLLVATVFVILLLNHIDFTLWLPPQTARYPAWQEIIEPQFCLDPNTVQGANLVKGHQPDAQERAAIEKMILASTARLYYRSWIPGPGEDEFDVVGSAGHATVIDGRYLLTHNHIHIPTSLQPGPGNKETYTYLTLTDWRGKERFSGPLTDFCIAYSAEEILVLTMCEPENPRWLEALGFQSAVCSAPDLRDLQSGTPVAQVDWDGSLTRVDWTVVDHLAVSGCTEKLYLDDPIRLGASGGGVFYNGAHIGNNWTIEIGLVSRQQVVYKHGTAAINCKELLSYFASPAGAANEQH